MTLSHAWMVLYWFWIALEVWVAVGRRAASSDAAGKDRGTQLLLWATIVLSLTGSGFLRAAHLAPMPAPELDLKLAAIALLALGLAVRMAAIATLGRAFTAAVATRSDQQLQRAGLYRVVRHPSYLGMEIIFLAIGLHAMDWVCLAVVLAPTTLAVLRRIGVEEEALRERFGAEYEAYSRATKRLIPGVY